MAQAIYAPRGRAAEYADLALNIYTGCSHGCRYCYAPGCLHKDRQSFTEQVAVRHRLFETLLRDCQTLKNSGAQVHLCFTCDPYQPLERETYATRRAIEMLHNHGLGVRILTKSCHAQRDFDLLTPQDAFGVTLTVETDHDAGVWEPGASLPVFRVGDLGAARSRGIPTWVSCEPVVDPDQTLSLIRHVAPVTDEIRVGCFNHSGSVDWPSEEWEKRVRQINWPEFGREVVALLENRTQARYYIKSDLWHKLSKASKDIVLASRRGSHG